MVSRLHGTKGLSRLVWCQQGFVKIGETGSCGAIKACTMNAGVTSCFNQEMFTVLFVKLETCLLRWVFLEGYWARCGRNCVGRKRKFFLGLPSLAGTCRRE
jgi:hypothetical protein